MNKKRAIKIIFSINLCIFANALIFSTIFLHKGFANELKLNSASSYNINFNSSKNKLFSHSNSSDIYSGEGTIKTELGNDVLFNYKNIKNSNSLWHILSSDSSFNNVDAISGLSNISIQFETTDVNFTISYSRDQSFNHSQEFSITNSSVFTYDFDNYYPNYFKISNLLSDDISISFMNLSFSCNNMYPTLFVISEDTNKGDVIGGGAKSIGENVEVYASPKEDYSFDGWYSDGELVSTKNPYSFIMPADDLTLYAKFITTEEKNWKIAHGVIPTLSGDGKTITYGLYPQTNVNDSSLLSALNTLTATESNGWYLYNNEYYAKLDATPFKTDYVFDNGTTIIGGTTYWFKCEPIIWNILSGINEEYYTLSNILLDVHCYYDDSSSSERTIDGQTIYGNNYEYSDIRLWLNNQFFDSAFALDSKNIQITLVDNSAATTQATTENNKACNDTMDKVFLPSYQDYVNSTYGFSTSGDSSNTRCCKATDWARARGANCSTDSSYLYNGYYWTRSPNDLFSAYAYHITYQGAAVYGFSTLNKRSVKYSHCCTRPAVSIKIV